jgi:LysR family transcriptional regulator, low CO2-responsive transcriptional regulator
MLSAAPMIDTSLLDSFATFGETKNFTRAARSLGVSQPALFERIQKLSGQVGLTLYERKGRDLVLTADGLRVLALAREVRERLRAFATELAGAPARTRVTLAAGEGSYLYLLGPGIAAFTKASSARLDLLTAGAKATVEALRSGEAQLGVAVLDLVPHGIEAEDLARTPLCVAMPAKHPLVGRRGLTLRDLRGDRLVLTPEGQTHRELVSRAFSRGGERLESPLEADGWPLMLKFVELGLGIAVVNGICDLPKGVVRRPLAELGTVTYRLLKRRGVVLSEEAQLLAKKLRAGVRTIPGASRMARS